MIIITTTIIIIDNLPSTNSKEPGTLAYKGLRIGSFDLCLSVCLSVYLNRVQGTSQQI